MTTTEQGGPPRLLHNMSSRPRTPVSACLRSQGTRTGQVPPRDPADLDPATLPTQLDEVLAARPGCGVPCSSTRFRPAARARGRRSCRQTGCCRSTCSGGPAAGCCFPARRCCSTPSCSSVSSRPTTPAWWRSSRRSELMSVRPRAGWRSGWWPVFPPPPSRWRRSAASPASSRASGADGGGRVRRAAAAAPQPRLRRRALRPGRAPVPARDARALARDPRPHPPLPTRHTGAQHRLRRGDQRRARASVPRPGVPRLLRGAEPRRRVPRPAAAPTGRLAARPQVQRRRARPERRHCCAASTPNRAVGTTATATCRCTRRSSPCSNARGDEGPRRSRSCSATTTTRRPRRARSTTRCSGRRCGGSSRPGRRRRSRSEDATPAVRAATG